MLTGMEVSPIAVQNSLEKLFPEERALALSLIAKKGVVVKKPSLLEAEEGEAEGGAEGRAADGAAEPLEMSTKTLAGPLNERDVSMVSSCLCLSLALLLS